MDDLMNVDKKILKIVSDLMDKHFIVVEGRTGEEKGLASLQTEQKTEFLKRVDEYTYNLNIFYWDINDYDSKLSKRLLKEFTTDLETVLETKSTQKDYKWKAEYNGKGTLPAMSVTLVFKPYHEKAKTKMGSFKDFLDI